MTGICRERRSESAKKKTREFVSFEKFQNVTFLAAIRRGFPGSSLTAFDALEPSTGSCVCVCAQPAINNFQPCPCAVGPDVGKTGSKNFFGASALCDNGSNPLLPCRFSQPNGTADTSTEIRPVGRSFHFVLPKSIPPFFFHLGTMEFRP